MKNKDDRTEQTAILRRQAEEIAREKAFKSPRNPEEMSLEETRQILHDLRVHQIELEMQNEELRRSQQELDAAGARYFDFYDLAPVGYLTLSEKGLILAANLTTAAMLDVVRSNLIKKPFSRFIFKEDQDTFYLNNKRLFNTAAPQMWELRMLKQDGTSFWARFNAIVAKDSDGEAVCRIVMSDITDRKFAEEAQLKLHKLESVGTLAGGIAHDFNNILATIQGYIELAKMDITPGNKGYNRMISIEKSILQATELTKRLITFAKGGDPIRVITNISAMVKNAILSSIGESPVGMKFYLDSDLWPAEIDEGQICQVIRNLVINAVEAMPEGGMLTVRVKNMTVNEQDRLPLSNGDYIRISLEDKGAGITRESLPVIFDPYFSTKQRGSEKGMGLGLSVCHSVVSKHDGCIIVESEERKGSTFHVYLPAAVNNASLIKKPKPDEKPGAKSRILVMDDDAMIRDMLSELLVAMGYDVETADDGLAAIDLYIEAMESRKPYQMLILDLTVPGGVGGKLTMERLRVINPDVKCIILSGYTDDPVIQNYQQYGFGGALTKPFTLKDLQNIFANILTN